VPIINTYKEKKLAKSREKWEVVKLLINTNFLNQAIYSSWLFLSLFLVNELVREKLRTPMRHPIDLKRHSVAGCRFGSTESRLSVDLG
jgi:hypothetical protein